MKRMMLSTLLLSFFFVGAAYAEDTTVTVKARVSCGAIKAGCKTNGDKLKKLKGDARQKAKKACKKQDKKFKGGSLKRKKSTCKVFSVGQTNGQTNHLQCDFKATCK